MWERDWTGAGSDVGRLSAGKRLIPIETLSPPACLHPKSATVWGQGGGGGGSGGGGGGVCVCVCVCKCVCVCGGE